MKAQLFALAAFVLCLLLAAPGMAGISVGLPADPGTGNCFPFGCQYSDYGSEYQQVYSNTQFSSPIAITSLEFFNTQLDLGSTAMNSGTWTISLSTTSADWNTLSTTYASNLGGNNTLVFTGNLVQPWAFGDTLQINLSTPFTYDPANGNLLMDIGVSGISAQGGIIYFDTNGHPRRNAFLGRVYSNGSFTVADYGYGLVTGFNQGGTVTPEPSTLLTLASGIIGLTGLARKRLFS
jgi:hypothetical protein